MLALVPQQLFPASPSSVALSPTTQPLTHPTFGVHATTVSAVTTAHPAGVGESLLQHAAERVQAAENTAAQTTRAAEQAVQDARTTAVWAVAHSQIDANARVAEV